jgi:hypothetical protein
VDDDYDKIPVARTIMSDPELAGTILRLPMVYGPGDMFHRLHPYLKRMDDRRPAVLIQEDAAQWRGPRGYVEMWRLESRWRPLPHRLPGASIIWRTTWPSTNRFQNSSGCSESRAPPAGRAPSWPLRWISSPRI